MKPVTQQTITISEIIDAVTHNSLKDARTLLASGTGATLEVTGRVLKVIKRDGLKFHVQAASDGNSRPMEVFTNFDAETERQRVTDAKIKKGSTVSIAGNLQSFGTRAVCLTACRLTEY